MWDSKAGSMRDVVMPGVGLYRTQAARSGECAGVSEPDFGPDTTETLGGQSITFPAWCRVTVKRRLPTGEVVEFTAKEFWKENYAVKGGKEKRRSQCDVDEAPLRPNRQVRRGPSAAQGVPGGWQPAHRR